MVNFGAVAFGQQSAKHLHCSDFGDEGVVIDLGRANGDAGTIVVEPVGHWASCIDWRLTVTNLVCSSMKKAAYRYFALC